MKISYFNYLYDLWGASIGSTVKAIELFRALEGLGHSVRFHWRKEHESDDSPGSGPGKVRILLKRRLDRFLHEPSQMVRNLNYLRQEFSILNRDRPDLLIARLETNVFSPPVLARHFHLPYVAEVDSPVMYEIRHFNKDYLLPYRLLDRMELDFIRKADRAFTVSEQLKAHFTDRGIPAGHLEVIPNAVDTARFFPGPLNRGFREHYGIDSCTVIGFIGSFHYWHGVDQLRLLIDTLLSRHSKAAFLLIGKGGPMRDGLIREIGSKSYADRVIPVDYLPHDRIPEAVHAMDIVLAPYPALPFFYYSPVKIYEYMACGKPVISSDTGQIAEVIQHDVNGILCQPGDMEAYLEAADRLIRGGKDRNRLGSAAAETIRARHTWTHRAMKLESLLRTVLK